MLHLLSSALLLVCSAERLQFGGALRHTRALDALQGTWVREQWTESGQPARLDDSGLRLVFEQNRWTLRIPRWPIDQGGLSLSEERRRLRFGYPEELDSLLEAGYALEGNTLRLRFANGRVELYRRELPPPRQ